MRFCVGLNALLLILTGSVPASANQPPRDPRCSDLKDISIALYFVHERIGKWPASVVGTSPSRSWRVDLLRYLDRADVAQKYDQAEPWNGPRNQALLAAAPDCYTPYDSLDVTEYFPDAPRLGDTWYLAPDGENTVWSGRVKNISDGMDRTIVLIEAPELRIPWLEPRDLTFDEAVELLGKPTKRYMMPSFMLLSMRRIEAFTLQTGLVTGCLHCHLKSLRRCLHQTDASASIFTTYPRFRGGKSRRAPSINGSVSCHYLLR
jgi:hypothetical protein